jgi:hypothetical protein
MHNPINENVLGVLKAKLKTFAVNLCVVFFLAVELENLEKIKEIIIVKGA